MKRTRFTEEQIIGLLKEAEAGAKTADLARRHGVSEATILPGRRRNDHPVIPDAHIRHSAIKGGERAEWVDRTKLSG